MMALSHLTGGQAGLGAIVFFLIAAIAAASRRS
jgi:hypothetical protein